jgi:hypothetical protein
MPVVAWSPFPHPRSASTRPVSGDWCPVSARPVSGCPLSGVSVGVRAFRVPVRVRCVRTGDFVERVGASGSHTAELAQAVLGQRRRRAGPGRRRGGARAAGRVRSHGRPGHAGCAGSPVGLGEQVGARCTPSCGMAARRSSGQGWRQAADHDLGWTAAATTSGARAVDLGPGVARSGRVLGSTAAEGARPHRGPSGQGARPGWARQPSELGEQWWACQDLNLGPHPYQVSRAQRCADRRFPRSLASVRGEGMRSIGA